MKPESQRETGLRKLTEKYRMPAIVLACSRPLSYVLQDEIILGLTSEFKESLLK